MSTQTTSVTTSPVRVLRSSLRLTVPLAVVGSVLLAGPAMADPPQQWPAADEVQFMDWFLLMLVFPVAATVVIMLLTLVPAFRKGETLGPQDPPVNGEWLGGPAGGRRALTDGEKADRTGGASGTW